MVGRFLSCLTYIGIAVLLTNQSVVTNLHTLHTDGRTLIAGILLVIAWLVYVGASPRWWEDLYHEAGSEKGADSLALVWKIGGLSVFLVPFLYSLMWQAPYATIATILVASLCTLGSSANQLPPPEPPRHTTSGGNGR
jgi:hypothetical protein